MDNVVAGATTLKHKFTVYISILASVVDFYNNDMLDDNCSIIITNFIDSLYTIFEKNKKLRGGKMPLRILSRESEFLKKQIGEHGKSFKIPIRPPFAGMGMSIIMETYAKKLEHKSNVLGFYNLKLNWAEKS